MMKNDLLEIEKKIEEHFKKYQNYPRFLHSKSVVQMALKLNEIHHLGLDEDLITLCGLLHDFGKVYPSETQEKMVEEQVKLGKIKEDLVTLKKVPLIWHSFIGPELIHQHFKINNELLDDAIYYHTTGKPAMNNLTKIIFLADYIEPSRSFKEASIVRRTAYRSLDEAVFQCLDFTIKHLKDQNKFIYPLTIQTYDFYQKK